MKNKEKTAYLYYLSACSFVAYCHRYARGVARTFTFSTEHPWTISIIHFVVPFIQFFVVYVWMMNGKTTRYFVRINLIAFLQWHVIALHWKNWQITVLSRIKVLSRRHFCCGSFLLLVLAVRIYTLVHLLCEWHSLVKFRKLNDHPSGKELFIRGPFVNCCQFMYLVLSLLVLRAGYGIWLYQFLIIIYLFTLRPLEYCIFLCQ